MKKLFVALMVFVAISCSSEKKPKIDVYSWEGGPQGGLTEEALTAQMKEFKSHHIKGLFYNLGFNVEGLKKAAKAAKEQGLEFHAWIPTMVQHGDDISKDWYGVSREGFSTIEKPAYVPHYTFLCPNREEVYDYLSKKYLEVAAIDGVDGVHLDYIRYPDVILARGLWDKYGLVMDQEYPQFDYCYCDKCVADFNTLTGVEIKAQGDSAQYNEAWKQFRYDVVTKFVNRLAEDIHSKTGKKISAAVFPGPSEAKRLVRQEWDKWNLDMVVPMNYNDFYLQGPEWVGQMTAEGVKALNGTKPLISGLFICPNETGREGVVDPEGHGLTADELEAAVRGSIDNGAAAVCLFMPSRMTPKHWEVLDQIILDYSWFDLTN